MRTFTIHETVARIKELAVNKKSGIVVLHGTQGTIAILERMDGLKEVVQHTTYTLAVGKSWLHIFEDGDNMVCATILETRAQGFTEYIVTSVSPDVMDYTEGNY